MVEAYAVRERPFSSLFLIGTEAAWQAQLGSYSRYRDLEDRVPVRGGLVDEVDPSAGDPWSFLRRMLSVLAPEAITLPPDGGADHDWAAAGAEEGAPAEIVVDVTHGYRAQAVLAAAAVAFALAEWGRLGVADPPRVRLLYGTFDPQTYRGPRDPVYPFWDLTQVVSAVEWSSALDALLRYGRADEIERLAKRPGGNGLVADFARKAKNLADDLVLVRLRSLFSSSAPALVDFLASHASSLASSHLPPMESALDQLRKAAEPLRSDRVCDRDGLRATAALAGLYAGLQRFAELAVVVGEGLQNHFGLAWGVSDLPEPGTKGMSAARRALKEAWRDGKAPGEPLEPAGEPNRSALDGNRALSSGDSRQVEARNDIAHAGLRFAPRHADELRSALEEHAREFGRLESGLRG